MTLTTQLKSFFVKVHGLKANDMPRVKSLSRRSEPYFHLLTFSWLAVYLAISCLIMFPPVVFGLSSDREQPMHIQADSGFIDDPSGVIVYQGDVTINQGTLQITADTVKIITSNRKIMQIIASTAPGSQNLAHYQQQPDNDDRLVLADAKIITYFREKKLLHLVGRAHLKQTSNTFKSERLHYNLVTGVIDLKGGTIQDGNRVNITLDPSKK